MRDRLHPEWRNLNEERKYPFSDNASLIPDSGTPIPTGAFLDAVFYPLDLEGVLFLSSVDRVLGTMTVSDASGVRGTAVIAGDVLQFVDDFYRPVGTLVLGPAFGEVSGAMIASVEATSFAAACVFPQNQRGVRAFLLPDSTLVTGDVTFAGEKGIRVDTTSESGKTVLRLQAIGVPGSIDCINIPPPVKCIKVVQTEGSTLTISQSGSLINLGARLNIADVCQPKNIPDEEGNLPLSFDDPCDAEPPQPVTPPFYPGATGTCAVHGGRYFILPITDLLHVDPYEEGTDELSTPLEGSSASELQKILDRLPPRSSQSIQISVRGF